MLLHPLRLLHAAAGSLIRYTISCAKQKSSPFFRFFDFYSDSAERCRKGVFPRACGWPPERKNTPGSPVSVFPFPFSFPESMTELPSQKRRTANVRQKNYAGGGDAHVRHFVSNQRCFFCCKRLILQYSNSWHASCLTEIGILNTHQINHQKTKESRLCWTFRK